MLTLIKTKIMKNHNHLSMLALGLILAFASCKKSDDQAPVVTDGSKLAQVSATNGTHLPFTVVTIAGDPKETGFADGAGKQARFYYPFGIDVADDGTIYVADFDNNKIRKITPPDIVSTINIPPASDGQILRFPEYVRLSNNGNLNVLSQDGMRRVWILKPDGTLTTPLPPSPYGNTWAFYSGLQKDPSGDFLWFSQQYYRASSTVTVPTSLKKFYLDANGRIGTNAFIPPRDSLSLPERDGDYSITSFFCGYNGVKYIVINNNHIYKLTPEGEFTQIYKDLTFKHIFSLTGSKDSRVLYVADNGAIKSIVNGKLQFLVGPQKYSVIAVDGVGSSANVTAHYLVLSIDESVLYFSDFTTIRKLLLK
jgi:DNA-binding beta-propeller fold protein YncE